jgi:hypothetical protein
MQETAQFAKDPTSLARACCVGDFPGALIVEHLH